MKLALILVAAFASTVSAAVPFAALPNADRGWCADQTTNNGGQTVYADFDRLKSTDIGPGASDCAAWCSNYPGTDPNLPNGGLLGFTWSPTPNRSGQPNTGQCICHYSDGTAPGDHNGCRDLKAADPLLSSCWYSGSGVEIDTVQVNPGNEGFWCYIFTGHIGVDGDPHFRTWKNEHFEFHGQCDLLMTKVKDFAGPGVDLEIQIRTKIVRFWSYIKSAAIRIGNDILEIEGSGKEFDSEARYWYNFESQAEMETFGGFPVNFRSNGAKNSFEIDLSPKFPGQKIILKTFKEFVGVKVDGATMESFGNAEGITGNFVTGKTLARDGATEMHDFIELGLEWQVLPSDGRLFHEVAKPQFPEKCYLPEDPRGDRKRRLDESSITEEAAEEACSKLTDDFDRKACIYDILATQDMDMVGAY